MKLYGYGQKSAPVTLTLTQRFLDYIFLCFPLLRPNWIVHHRLIGHKNDNQLVSNRTQNIHAIVSSRDDSSSGIYVAGVNNLITVQNVTGIVDEVVQVIHDIVLYNKTRVCAGRCEGRTDDDTAIVDAVRFGRAFLGRAQIAQVFLNTTLPPKRVTVAIRHGGDSNDYVTVIHVQCVTLCST